LERPWDQTWEAHALKGGFSQRIGVKLLPVDRALWRTIKSDRSVGYFIERSTMAESAKIDSPVDAEVVLVLGGTGHLGSDVVEHLLRLGRHVRVLARRPGSDARVSWFRGDLSTGEGLDAAFSGVKHVIHAATNSPIARRGGLTLRDLRSSPEDVDIHGTRYALEAAERQCVERFLFVSIVGLEDSKLPYSRVKLAGERLVRASRIPWSVVKTTPFFYLVERLLEGLHRWPFWPLPRSPFQPVDTRDVAGYLVDCLDGDRHGLLAPMGGPDVTSYAAMARAHLAVRGRHKPIIDVPLPEHWARSAGLVTLNDGVKGVRTWQRWLEERTAGL
jgi:uncharacterized protein YbjT (DUF2867 family)